MKAWLRLASFQPAAIFHFLIESLKQDYGIALCSSTRRDYGAEVGDGLSEPSLRNLLPQLMSAGRNDSRPGKMDSRVLCI